MFTLDQYESLVTALRQRLNKKRHGRYRRLSLSAIRERIDRQMFPPGEPGADDVGAGVSFGHVCDQCGACCRKLGIHVNQVDLDREPRLVAATKLADFTATDGRKMFELCIYQPCPMLDGNRCTIQDTKPTVCSRTPPGGFCCQYSRRQDGLPSLKPSA